MRQLLVNSQLHTSLRKCASIRTSDVTKSILASSQDCKLSRHQHVLKSGASFSSQSDSSISLQERGIFDEHNLLKFDTLHELQSNASIAFADNPLFGKYVKPEGEDAKFEYMTYSDFGGKVDTCRALLKDLGIQEYSKVGIISNNRWEWAAIASAAYGLNSTLVPMYEAQLPKDWTYIVNDSESSVVFCATQDIYDRFLAEVLPQTPSVKAVLCLDGGAGEQHIFATQMEAASKNVDESSIIKPSVDDLANLIYTSGTTGKPKGVELIHSNTVSNIKGIRLMADDVHDFLRESDRSLSFLPWAHSFGQTCELWVGMAHGGSSGICRGVPFILEDLQLVKPTILFSVPALHKKVYDGVNNLIESSSPLRKNLMKSALALGRKNVIEKNGGEAMGFIDRLKHKVLDKIVLSKIRDRFGGNLRHGFVGGAAMPMEVIDFLDDVGITICEGYGLTETTPVITMNSPFDRKTGTVGKPLPGVNVVIMGENGVPLPPGEEGEICVYGPNIMRGYYKKPEATEEVISLAPDGKSRLFHTGDLGRMPSDGFVKVTGRLKEQYKLENGKYVCPTPIEETISLSRFVMQVVLCGANRPHNVALVVPDWVAIRATLKVDDSVSEEELVNDERVKALVKADIGDQCKNMKKFEVPQDFAFVAPFTAANNMLTPKMSIRRHMVIREYGDVIAKMYGDECASDGVKDEVVA